MKALKINVSGRVQGVWFRASARDEARRIGVTGWVRNVPDGTVEVFVQGQEEKLNKFLSWCYQGPPGAYVEEVNYNEVPADPSMKTFSIRY
jgi:acylphosphatase